MDKCTDEMRVNKLNVSIFEIIVNDRKFAHYRKFSDSMNKISLSNKTT